MAQPAATVTGTCSVKQPVVCLVIGMAGSGKTTLMQRIHAHVRQHKTSSYVVNLDPAVHSLPYEPNIDIRDTVNYKKVMKEFALGPNGAILTSLNLFATKFDQLLSILEKRSTELDYIFIDTPGQIEVFTWSASGQIITETLASLFPTVLIYVIDTPRSIDPITFMSNMTYACSILYKTKLPFLIAFNKIDVQSHLFALDWMNSPENFEDAIQSNETYMSTLVKSLSNVLDVFYCNIKSVGVSAVTGQGMTALFDIINNQLKSEYLESYLPMIESKRKQRKMREANEKREKIEQIKQEMEMRKTHHIKGELKTIYEPTQSTADMDADIGIGDAVVESMASVSLQSSSTTMTAVPLQTDSQSQIEKKENPSIIADTESAVMDFLNS